MALTRWPASLRCFILILSETLGRLVQFWTPSMSNIPKSSWRLRKWWFVLNRIESSVAIFDSTNRKLICETRRAEKLVESTWFDSNRLCCSWVTNRKSIWETGRAEKLIKLTLFESSRMLRDGGSELNNGETCMHHMLPSLIFFFFTFHLITVSKAI